MIKSSEREAAGDDANGNGEIAVARGDERVRRRLRRCRTDRVLVAVARMELFVRDPHKLQELLHARSELG